MMKTSIALAAVALSARASNVSRVQRVCPQKDWENNYFPRRMRFYTYAGFIEALSSYPDVCSGTDNQCKLELAALFANMAQETGDGRWDGGLQHMSEWSCTRSGHNMDVCEEHYNHEDANYPPAEGEVYYGRGPLQISHNYNYGRFGSKYLTDPDRVFDNDSVDAFESALWFWTQTDGNKPSMHSVAS